MQDLDSRPFWAELGTGRIFESLTAAEAQLCVICGEHVHLHQSAARMLGSIYEGDPPRVFWAHGFMDESMTLHHPRNPWGSRHPLSPEVSIEALLQALRGSIRDLAVLLRQIPTVQVPRPAGPCPECEKEVCDADCQLAQELGWPTEEG